MELSIWVSSWRYLEMPQESVALPTAHNGGSCLLSWKLAPVPPLSSFPVFLSGFNRWKGVRGSKGVVINGGQGRPGWSMMRVKPFPFPSPSSVQHGKAKYHNGKVLALRAILGLWQLTQGKGGLLSTDSTQQTILYKYFRWFLCV